MGAKRMRTSRQKLIEEPATLADRTANGAGADAEPARELALEEAARKLINELSGNTGELIDMMASAIRADGSDLCDGAWESLSDDRKLAWRGDAERALAAVKEYLTTRALSSPDHAGAGKVEGDGWLPIESAPKDTYVLAWGDNFHWRGVEKAYVHSDYNGHVGVICKHGIAGTPFSGRDAPSHWRPIPTLPTPPAGEMA